MRHGAAPCRDPKQAMALPGEDFPQYNPEGYTPEGSYPAEPLDPQAPYTPGNRPASGARRATPGEVLTRGFQGSQAAGDFLGLDLEFTANQANDPTASGLDLESAPMIGQEPYPSSAPSPDAFAPPVDSGFGGGPSSYEFGEDLGKDELGLDPTPKKNPARTLLVALAVGGLVATGILYGPGLYSRFAPKKEPPREVARAPREAPVPPVADPATGAVVPTTDPALVDPAPAPVGFEDPLVSASSDPVDQSLDPIPTPFSFDSEPDAGLDPEASVASDESEPATDIVASLLGSGAVGPMPSGGTSTFPNLAGSDFEWASEDMLELIWRGDEVPMEAVFAPARTMMPRVGPVRVFTNSGDVFEGRLYAVGQERVWIDAAPGRIGLDGNRIERIERLPFEPGSTDGTEFAETGKRVRVRVPGGLLFGRVLKTEGDEVILALDDGGRVRVQSDSVEDIGSGRAIIVHR